MICTRGLQPEYRGRSKQSCSFLPRKNTPVRIKDLTTFHYKIKEWENIFEIWTIFLKHTYTHWRGRTSEDVYDRLQPLEGISYYNYVFSPLRKSYYFYKTAILKKILNYFVSLLLAIIQIPALVRNLRRRKNKIVIGLTQINVQKQQPNSDDA